MGNKNETKRIIEQLENLPTLPVIMLKILECIDNPHSSAGDLKNIISNDVAISAKILRLANSALFAQSHEIVDIGRAIVVLGFNMVVDVAISVSFASLMMPQKSALVISMEDFWEHDIAAAQAGRIIGTSIGYPHLEQAFIIGLMHDIGKLVLATHFTKDFNCAVEESQDYDLYLCETEEKVFGFNHADAGALLARHWNFPEQLIMSIQYHHHYSELPEKYKKEILIAHVADYLAKINGIGNSGDNNKIPMLHPDVFNSLVTSEYDLSLLSEELVKNKALIKTFIEAIL